MKRTQTSRSARRARDQLFLNREENSHFSLKSSVEIRILLFDIANQHHPPCLQQKPEPTPMQEEASQIGSHSIELDHSAGAQDCHRSFRVIQLARKCELC